MGKNLRYSLFGKLCIIEKPTIEQEIYDTFILSARNITYLPLPDTIEIIESEALYNCTILEKIKISSNSKLRIIKDDAFKNSKISRIFIPRHITMIGRTAFSSNHLEQVDIDDNSELQMIGDYAFSHSKIKHFSVPIHVK